MWLFVWWTVVFLCSHQSCSIGLMITELNFTNYPHVRERIILNFTVLTLLRYCNWNCVRLIPNTAEIQWNHHLNHYLNIDHCYFWYWNIFVSLSNSFIGLIYSDIKFVTFITSNKFMYCTFAITKPVCVFTVFVGNVHYFNFINWICSAQYFNIVFLVLSSFNHQSMVLDHAIVKISKWIATCCHYYIV